MVQYTNRGSDSNTAETDFRVLTWRTGGNKLPIPADEAQRPILFQRLPGYSDAWLIWVEGSPPHGTWVYNSELAYSNFFQFGRARVVHYPQQAVVERFARSQARATA